MPRNKNQNLYVILSSHNNFISIFYYVTLSNAFNSPFGYSEITKRIYKKKNDPFYMRCHISLVLTIKLSSLFTHEGNEGFYIRFGKWENFRRGKYF